MFWVGPFFRLAPILDRVPNSNFAFSYQFPSLQYTVFWFPTFILNMLTDEGIHAVCLLYKCLAMDLKPNIPLYIMFPMIHLLYSFHLHLTSQIVTSRTWLDQTESTISPSIFPIGLYPVESWTTFLTIHSSVVGVSKTRYVYVKGSSSEGNLRSKFYCTLYTCTVMPDEVAEAFRKTF